MRRYVRTLGRNMNLSRQSLISTFNTNLEFLRCKSLSYCNIQIGFFPLTLFGLTLEATLKQGGWVYLLQGSERTNAST